MRLIDRRACKNCVSAAARGVATREHAAASATAPSSLGEVPREENIAFYCRPALYTVMHPFAFLALVDARPRNGGVPSLRRRRPTARRLAMSPVRRRRARSRAVPSRLSPHRSSPRPRSRVLPRGGGVSAHALERAERSRVDVAGAARAARRPTCCLSRALERAEDALAANGDVEREDVGCRRCRRRRLWLGGAQDGRRGGRAEGGVERDRCASWRGPVGGTPLLLMFLYGRGGDGGWPVASAKYAGDACPETERRVRGGEYRGESALHIAIVNENDELVDWLCGGRRTRRSLGGATGLLPRTRRAGRYALSFAVSTGQEVVNTLLEAGADATAQDTTEYVLALAIHNRPEIRHVV